MAKVKVMAKANGKPKAASEKAFRFTKRKKNLLRSVIRDNCIECMCFDFGAEKCTKDTTCPIERCLSIVESLYDRIGEK